MKTLTLTLAFYIIATLQIHAQQGWGQIQKLVPDDRYAGQTFGSVMDMDGDYAIVGTAAEEAYVFEKDETGVWLQVQKLESPDGGVYDYFGHAVAISENIILIGAFGETLDENGENYFSEAGAVYLFERDNLGVWNNIQKITADERVAGDQFGVAMDIDEDKVIIGLGNHNLDENGENYLQNAGAAYIFEREETGTWTQVQKLVASDRAEDDSFGQWGLAINGDYASVSAIEDDEDEDGQNYVSNSGSAYIFKRNVDGIWTEHQKIVASDREDVQRFGYAIAMDNDHMVVSNIYATRGDAYSVGAAYVFEKSENNLWSESQILTASDWAEADQFGFSAGIDGNRIILGAPGKDVEVSGITQQAVGVAYLYERANSGVWNQEKIIQGLGSDESDFFGSALGISGNLALIGALYQAFDETGANQAINAGAVYVFDASQISTGVANHSNPNFKAFPNPTNGQLTIDLGDVYSDVNIKVTNLLGQVVIEKSVKSTREFQLQFNVPDGLYLMGLRVDRLPAMMIKVVIK